MTKELEAWETIKSNYLLNNALVNNEVEIVETALKRLEELEKAFDSLSKEDEKTKKLLSKEIEKNRALEIIKEKELLSVFQVNKNHKCFVVFTGKYGFENKTEVEISQEEFDLLKEVLL